MTARTFLIAMFVATGCGSVSNPGSDGGPDAAVGADAAATPDGSTASCRPEQTFGTPTLVAGISSTVEEGAARLTSDELTLYLARGQAISANILVATRPSISDPFDAPVALTGFVDPAVGTHFPTLTDDGLTMVFTRSIDMPPTGEVASLEVARRTTPTGDFAAGVPLDMVNQQPNLRDTQPYLLPSGERLYFMNTPTTMGDSNIYVSDAVVNDFGPSTLVAELSSPGPDHFPVVSPDDLTIYFARITPGAVGLDVYVATRNNLAETFSGIRAVAEVNSTEGDRPTWISPDLCRLYLLSNRNGFRTEVFVAERTP